MDEAPLVNAVHNCSRVPHRRDGVVHPRVLSLQCLKIRGRLDVIQVDGLSTLSLASAGGTRGATTVVILGIVWLAHDELDGKKIEGEVFACLLFVL
jgi:hypothetical protein